MPSAALLRCSILVAALWLGVANAAAAPTPASGEAAALSFERRLCAAASVPELIKLSQEQVQLGSAPARDVATVHPYVILRVLADVSIAMRPSTSARAVLPDGTDREAEVDRVLSALGKPSIECAVVARTQRRWQDAAVSSAGKQDRASAQQLVDVLERIADVLLLVKRPEPAVVLRTAALAARTQAGVSVTDYVVSRASLALALLDAWQTDRALAVIAEPLGMKNLGDAARGILLELESRIHTCAGAAVHALTRWEARTALPPPKRPVDAMLEHVDLLKRAAAAPGVSAVNASRWRALADAHAHTLTHIGPWVHPQQLPKQFIPGLASAPWHDWSSAWPHLAPVVALLESYTAALRREYLSLSAHMGTPRSKYYRQTECIHEPRGGAWYHYSINGFWLDLDANGCSVDTPVACKLVQDVRERHGDVEVLRAGYSTVLAGAHLQPHFGISNAQLKFHLGLITPRHENGTFCARMRVGNRTRAWREGKAWLFDDSYEHELVIVHPQLTERRRKAGEGGATGAAQGMGASTYDAAMRALLQGH